MNRMLPKSLKLLLLVFAFLAGINQTKAEAPVYNLVFPTVTLTTSVGMLFNGPFTGTAVFSEAVHGFTVTGISATNCTVSSLSSSDNITYTFTVTTISEGPVSIQVQANAALNGSNEGNTASNKIDLFYDHTRPFVNSVSVPSGVYKLGDVLTFTAANSERCNVSAGPYLSFNVGSNPERAMIDVGASDAQPTAFFRYTVKAGDFDNDGIVLTGATITLNGGSMRDIAGNAIIPLIPGSISYSGIIIDGVVPTVTSVDVPVNGYYKAGDVLNFRVHTSETVSITGATTLELNIGGTTRPANLLSGSGSNVLVFGYTVQPGDIDMDGITLGSLNLNGGAIQDGAGNDMDLPLNGVPSTSGVFVNTQTPSVVITAPPGIKAAPFTATITFSEAVIGVALGDFSVTNATLSNLNAINNFTYTLLVTPAMNGQVTLLLPANMAVNIGNNGNTASNTLTVTYDANAPLVTTVDFPATGTYRIGDVLNFTVNFNENVLVTGTPFINILMHSSIKPAHYVGGSGTTQLTFTYTIQAGDFDADGVSLINTMQLNGGTIRDAAGNNANLLLSSPSPNVVIIDGVAPAVSQVNVPANGIYKLRNVLSFSIDFTENVTVSGTPVLNVIIGSTTVRAIYTGGSGTSNLTFAYSIQVGIEDHDGIQLSSLITNGGTLQDDNGNDAILTLNNAGNTSGVLVDAKSPTVILSGTPVANAPFTATLTFSEQVTGLTIADVAVSKATVSNLQTTDNVTFTMLVTPVSDGAVSVTLQANAVTDIAGNFNITSNTLSFTADVTAPTVTRVDVPADGYYKAGLDLNFTVVYSENVIVNTTGGTPIMPIDLGGVVKYAFYKSGSGTNSLVFTYTVQNGDMDMDGVTVPISLLMNSGSMVDNADNTVVLNLHNVANTTNVRVNTARPSVTINTTAPARVNATFPVTITFSEPVTGFTISSVVATNGTASTLQTTDNITYTIQVTPIASGTININIPTGAAVNIGNNDNTASNTISLTADLTAPVITSSQHFSILANSAVGTTINTATATDASGIIQNWSIASDPSGGAFAINATTGVITINNLALLNAQSGRTVTLTLTVSDGLNTSAATTIAIDVLALNQAPALNPIANAATCANGGTQTIQLTGVSAVEPTQTFNLSVAASQPYFEVLTVTNAGVLSYKLKSTVTAGQVTITVTIQDNGGTANGGVDKSQQSFTLTVNPLPVITLTSDKGNTVSKGEVVRLTATGGASYNWDNTPGIVSGQQTAVLEIRPQANTTYPVQVTSVAGCTSTASINIAIVEDFKVDATNILTPNGDGKNDRWVIHNIDSYPNNEVKIFDRAGRLIYQRRNYSNEWDGTLNGNPLAEGTYYYILTISGGKTAKGSISIIRDRY
ncbi:MULTISPECIES: Ig-like domain-containing protein [Niastella]|uniref:Gliding motility-associated C-terminal domain-containing protein n=1 Tax=Niastella soli TaxID=2821487 RepID=A0ABS3YYC2_9BACT|nr:Ig-like domain-containing protein [Niastella soli]MBO9202878.1 gliding motility-associated C-terminal domain-containing protein [Niastella soli]